MKKRIVTLVVVMALIVGSLQMSTGTAKAASGSISVSGFKIGNAPQNANGAYQLLQSRPYDILGSVKGTGISSVEVRVRRQGSATPLLSVPYVCNPYQYVNVNIKDSVLNTNMPFGDLTVGNYELKLVIAGPNVYMHYEVNFKVQDDPIISLDGFKSTLTYNKGYGIPGYVASNVPIRKIDVTVYFRNGDNPVNWSVANYRSGYTYSGAVRAEINYPSGNYWTYSGTALDNNIHFAGLMRGPYALIVTVYPTSGPAVSKTVSFTVK
ncbi:MAG: hypothetical protein J5531_07370 [Lachnospiraceae bacterium]|nr:hypothetical protein [Lachnospiraceae bacterium]